MDHRAHSSGSVLEYTAYTTQTPILTCKMDCSAVKYVIIQVENDGDSRTVTYAFLKCTPIVRGHWWSSWHRYPEKCYFSSTKKYSILISHACVGRMCIRFVARQSSFKQRLIFLNFYFYLFIYLNVCFNISF